MPDAPTRTAVCVAPNETEYDGPSCGVPLNDPAQKREALASLLRGLDALGLRDDLVSVRWEEHSSSGYGIWRSAVARREGTQ